MKIAQALKKSILPVLLGVAIISLGTSTAFAETTESVNKSSFDSNYKNNQKDYSLDYKTSVSPIETLAKILNQQPQTIQKSAQKTSTDVYEYAQKKKSLPKFKAERMIIAKQDIQKAVATNKITKDKGSNFLAKVESNIKSGKPESMGIVRSQKNAPNGGTPLSVNIEHTVKEEYRELDAPTSENNSN